MTAQLHSRTRTYPLWHPAVLTSALAGVINIILFVAVDAAGVEFAIDRGSASAPMELNVGHVAVTTVLALVVGWGAAALARRRGRPGLATVAVVGGVVAAVSAVFPLVTDADLGARLTLAAMHLVTGACFVVGIERLRRAEGGLR